MLIECNELLHAGHHIFVELPCGGVGVSAAHVYTHTHTHYRAIFKTQVMWEFFHLSNCITEQQTLHG